MAITKYFKKPIFIGTLICAFFFYCFEDIFQSKEELTSLVNNNDITFIYGKLITSPVKTSNGKYYSCRASILQSGNNKIISSSKGKIQIYIPANLVEAYYPGKLFSKSYKSYKSSNYSKFSSSSLNWTTELNAKTKYINSEKLIFDTGGYYCFTGQFFEHGFFVKKCLGNYWFNNISGIISYSRAISRLYFKRLMYGWGNGGGLLLSLLSGSREYTEKDTALYFKNAGLSHILALSGMHLSMFSVIAIFLGKKIGRKKLSFYIRLIILSLFVWFAGLSPSLLRAFICSLLVIMATMAGVEKPDMIMILCFSFLLQSIIRPEDIYNIGFMLSYGALAGILLTGQFFNNLFVKIIPCNISSSLSASVGAQLFTAPITLKMFGTFTPIGIIATTIISPLITIFIYSGIIFIIATLIFPPLQQASGIFINLQYNVIKNLVKLFSKVPAITIH